MHGRALRVSAACVGACVQVGLCGGHAYSILSVREARTSSGRVRLLRIRNPHGVGEWNGEWSDASAKWAELIADGDASARGANGARACQRAPPHAHCACAPGLSTRPARARPA
eukprot:1314523-Pleurochrysis_carterae.AAC.2